VLLTREKLIKIFQSEKFAKKVPSPFLYMFTDEYPPICEGYWEKDGDVVYTDYDLSSDYSAAFSLIIHFDNDEVTYIQFDDDDGAARWEDQELEEQDWKFRRF